jgi:IclR family acetate operon transcriptional repressor
MRPRLENKTQTSSLSFPSTRIDEAGAKPSRSTFLTTVAKALSILDRLATYSEAGASLTELSAALKMPKSSTHRYLATLLELRLAERIGDERFRLGTKVIELAGSFLASSELQKVSDAILNEIAEKSGETTHLAVPSGVEVVYIAKVEGRHTLGMFSHIGARLPMHCTALGKSILAFSAPEHIQDVLPELSKPRTPNTITSEQALREELDLIRTQGFAIDNEENEVGIRCVGAPIMDYTGRAIAAMSISGPRDRMDRERCLELGPVLREAVLRISRRKGFTGKI